MLLRERGHYVRVLSALPRDGDDCGVGMPDYVLPPLRIPLVDPLIASQGYSFARAKRCEIERALAWADVVHLEEPFYLQAALRATRAGGACPSLRPITFTPRT